MCVLGFFFSSLTTPCRFPDLWAARAVSFTLYPGDTFVYVDLYSAQAVAMPLLPAADKIYSQEVAPPVD